MSFSVVSTFCEERSLLTIYLQLFKMMSTDLYDIIQLKLDLKSIEAPYSW